MRLSLIFLLGCRLSFCALSFEQQQAGNGGGWVTVTLENLTNQHGVLSRSSQRCDRQSECDTYVRVTVGSAERGHDLLMAETDQIWKNKNNLSFVFFNRTFAVNASLPNPMYIRIVVMDENMGGDQEIGEFHHTVNLQESKSTTMQLYSTAENRLVSLTGQVTVACFKFYRGPTCSEFCKEAPDCGDNSDRALCQDGTAHPNCPTGARERTSATETRENMWSQWSGIAHWAVPVVCGVALIIVLVALGVRLVRTRATEMIVAVQDPECQQPQNPGDGGRPHHLQLPTDQARKFHNPVYSSLRWGNRQYIRSSSTTTQSSVATDATDLQTGQDDYEDLDAFGGDNPSQQRRPSRSPRQSPLARRPLPQPGGV